MKNIHILPTEKPSRIYKNEVSELGLLNKKSKNLDGFCISQNICITSDEEIKEGDWCYFKEDNLITKTKTKLYVMLANSFKTDKKIILTTDQDLIADGVQAIDDEFLEWFVKNQSCEKVEVEKEQYHTFVGMKKYPMIPNYKIIIPKEEPQQQRTYSEEDMKKAFYYGYCCENKYGIEVTFNDWFIKFKNK